MIDHYGATIYEFPVAGKNLSVTEETGATPIAPEEIGAAETKEAPRGFLKAARRTLSEEELSTPAARRFLISEIERLDQICADNQGFVTKYHDQRVIIATLTETGKKSRRNEILSLLCFSIGCAGIGAAPAYLVIPNAQHFGWVVFGLSAILVIGGLVLKEWK